MNWGTPDPPCIWTWVYRPEEWMEVDALARALPDVGGDIDGWVKKNEAIQLPLWFERLCGASYWRNIAERWPVPLLPAPGTKGREHYCRVNRIDERGDPL